MNKIFISIIIATTSLLALDIPIEKVKKHLFAKEIELNAKVVQLSNAKQAIMSMVGGHIEEYFVKAGQSIKVGQKIALIKSIELSQMTAEYVAVKKQFYSLNKNYKASKKLYDKGLTSQQELNQQSIQKDALLSKITSLKSQLQTLGIDTDNLKVASSDYTLYAHSEGTVSALLQPLHAVIDREEEIISVIKNQAFYLKSYLPLKYASSVKIGDKIVTQNITTHITQILPQLDEQSQRVVLLSNVEQKTDKLFIGAYLPVTLYTGDTNEQTAVKKSALSFFNNEWVVFVPKEQEEYDEHTEHDKHDEHTEHDEHKEHEDHDEHASHEGHDEHEGEEVPYEAHVVEILAEDANYVAVKGLEVGEEYVSDKSYYVKSMLLKSSLGGHGH
jgi:multidrug efflux pump subunit AcrA (membrane-fusion protein)